jgi:hypothetical protein
MTNNYALSHLHQIHADEWIKGSGVAPEIVSLNVRSLSRTLPHEYLLYSDKLERRNSGRLSDGYLRRYQHLEDGGWWCSGVDILTGKDSMWGCFKPNSPHVATENNNQGHIKKQKTIKYEHPPKVDTEVFALKIPYRIGLEIATTLGLEEDYGERIWPGNGKAEKTTKINEKGKGGQKASQSTRSGGCSGSRRSDLSSSTGQSCNLQGGRNLEPGLLNAEDDGFWQWVIDNANVPIVLTEGAKKAGALLSAGYCAIAIPGIFNGYRNLLSEGRAKAKGKRQKEEDRSFENDQLRQNEEKGSLDKDSRFAYGTASSYLIPQLQILAKEGREIYFAFDSDSKASTIANVNIAIEKTAKLLEKEGCTCRVISWSNQYKGVDDFIVARGIEAFNQAYQQARTIALWKVLRLKQLTYEVTVEIDPLLRYLPKLDIPSTAKIIGLKARKGRGKTHQIAELVSEAIRQGRRTLIISHRRQLVANLCDRCGIDNVTEYRNSDSGGVFGYGLCVDSLRRHSQARFNPEEWEDALIIIDEVEQVFWHLLSASTQVKQYRVEILKNFRTLLRVVIGSEKGQVLVADADLSDISLDYIRSLVPNAPEPFIIHQPFDPSTITEGERWEVINYPDTNPKRLILDLIAYIRQGGKPFVCVSAQKMTSQFGTINLESTLRQYFPDLRILRIDSESIADPNHPAFGCITHLNEVLPNYDLVLASPSIETGVSIDLKGHFTSVWAIASGTSADNAVCQALSRVRENVPRYLWISKVGHNRIGNGTTNVKELFAFQKRETQAHLKLLLESEDYEIHGIDCQFQVPSLWCWARMAVRVNLGMISYRQSVLDAMAAEGHFIRNVDDVLNDHLLPFPVKKETDINDSLNPGVMVQEFDSNNAEILDNEQGFNPSQNLDNTQGFNDVHLAFNHGKLALSLFEILAIFQGVNQGKSFAQQESDGCLVVNSSPALTDQELEVSQACSEGLVLSSSTMLTDHDMEVRRSKEEIEKNLGILLLWLRIFQVLTTSYQDHLSQAELTLQKQEQIKFIGQQLKQVSVDNCQTYHQKVSEISAYTHREYEEVSRRNSRTDEEKIRLHKTRLTLQYQTEDISPELVELDAKGVYKGMRLHYYLTVGRPYLKRRERHRLDKLLKQGHGALFSPDFNRQSLSAKIWLYEFLQFVPLLNKTCLHKDDPDLQRLAPFAKRFAADIKQILGVTINPKDSPVTVYRQLLRPLGITQLPKLGRLGERGDRHHVYNNPDWTERFAIFERWLAKEPPLPQEQPSPIDWALELLQRLEMPSVSFVDDESANLFLRGVQDKLSEVIEEVEQVCSGFCDRFWRAFTSAISHV